MRRFLFCVVLALCTLPPVRGYGLAVRDARGAMVTVAHAPRRIVSLAPGATEMLFALGLGGRVVGDTVFCDYPSAARSIAKVGDVNTNIEKVLALRPDLIVSTDANRSATLRLTQLHLPVFVLAPTSFMATEDSLRRLGQITGAVEPAAKAVAQMEAKRHNAEAIARHDGGHHPRVLVVISLNPLWTAGAGTFIDDVLRRAGGVNTGASVPLYAPFSKETLLTHPPDMILAGPREAAAMRRDPVFRTLAAVQAGRFFSVNSDLLTRPGPRLADALVQVARALHPGVQ